MFSMELESSTLHFVGEVTLFPSNRFLVYILKAIRNATDIFIGFSYFMAMFLAFALLEATCLSYENLFTNVALRCSLMHYWKNGKNIKFLVDPF